MNALFSPAVGLMNRLPYLGKFALLACLFGVVNCTFLAELMISKWQTIRDSQREVAGVQVLTPLTHLVHDLQQHRAHAVAALDGNAAMAAKVPEKRSAVDAGFQAVEAVDRNGTGNLEIAVNLADLKSRWNDIASGSKDPSENFKAHTELIANVIALMNIVGDRSSLSYESDVLSNQLGALSARHVPELAESYARLRGLGTRFLSDGVLTTEESGQLSVLLLSVQGREQRLAHVSGELSPQRPELARQVESLLPKLAQARADVEKALDAAKRGSALPAPEYFQLASAPVSLVEQLSELSLPALTSVMNDRLSKTWASMWLHIAFAVVASIAVLYLLTGFYLSTHRSFDELGRSAEAFAKGDFSRRIKAESRDEVAVIVHQFNKMADGIGELLQEVQRGVRTLNETSAQLSRASMQVTQASHRQSDAAQSTASAVEQMSVSISHVAESVESSVETSQRARELSETGESVVRVAAQEIMEMAGAVRNSSALIEQLSEHSSRVSGIVRVIRDVADQTNLLALNAAIEAARAGEMGRGFAVVADEVRKLAERTAHATSEIAAVIENIEQGTRNSVDGIQNATARVDSGVEQANRAAAALAEIHGGTSVTLERIASIAAAAREQRETSHEIAINVESIARMAEENEHTVREIEGAAHNVEQQAAALAGLMQRFRTAA